MTDSNEAAADDVPMALETAHSEDTVDANPGILSESPVAMDISQTTPPVKKKEPSEAAVRVASFVIDTLRTAVATEHSVHTCAGSIQNKFGHDPALLEMALNAFVDFFLSVDNATRKTSFYILNDLVQYDPRFRLPVLRIVLPAIAWTVSMMAQKDVYLKTLTVWEHRKVYPSEVCKTIETAFQASDAARKNATEYEQRLNSLVDIIRIRSAKDEDLERLFRETPSDESSSCSVLDGKTLTPATIMAASTPELRNMTIMNRAVLLATQGTIEYLNRLLLDCESQYASVNTRAMQDVLQVIKRSTSPTNQPCRHAT